MSLLDLPTQIKLTYLTKLSHRPLFKEVEDDLGTHVTHGKGCFSNNEGLVKNQLLILSYLKQTVT